MTARRIFIGDIQGCREELEELLEKLDFDPATDELHPVGDFVNRGPDSLGVLRLMKSLGAGGVMGNHDLHFLQRVRGERKAGRRDTLDELLASDECADLAVWLEARPVLRAWPDLLLVHAGLSPTWSDPVAELTARDPLVAHPSTEFAVYARYCDPAGTMSPSDRPPPEAPFRPWHEYWSERTNEARTVVFGHWAMQGLVVAPRLRGLDTGCVWGNSLTAWIAEEDRLVQVAARRTHSELS